MLLLFFFCLWLPCILCFSDGQEGCYQPDPQQAQARIVLLTSLVLLICTSCGFCPSFLHTPALLSSLMASPVSMWACSAQCKEDLALSHSCTWQTTCFSFHPHQGNARGKQWCNRDKFRSQRVFRDPQKSLERININYANITLKSRLDCFPYCK